MRDALEPERGGFEVDADEIRWWTFAGGRINSTLRYAIESLGQPWKIVADNFGLRVRGDDLDWPRFQQELEKLSELELWEDDYLWQKIAEGLPAYRLSKFQPLMPPWVEREVIAGYLLDVGGAWRWLSGSRSISSTPLARVPPDRGPGAPSYLISCCNELPFSANQQQLLLE